MFGHGARKRDHFARAVFVSIVRWGGSMINMERIDMKRPLPIVDPVGVGWINN